MGFIDIHSHILHNIDDGSKSIEQSLKLLESEKENGCTSVLLTPHFYPDFQPLNGYMEHRDKQFKLLKEATENKGLPKLHLGCELRYYNGITNCDVAESFCLGNTNYLLLELPFTSPIDKTTVNEIRNLADILQVNIILAHVERYFRSSKYNDILDLIYNGDCLCQIDTDSFFINFYKKAVIKLVKSNLVSFLGSDAHSIEERPVTIAKAKEFMAENGMQNQLDVCLKNAEEFEKLLNDNE